MGGAYSSDSSTDFDVLTFCLDSVVEPMEGMHLTNVSFAVERSATTGSVRAGSDATDARFWTPDEFADSTQSFTDVHVQRFESDSLHWLLDEVRGALKT